MRDLLGLIRLTALRGDPAAAYLFEVTVASRVRKCRGGRRSGCAKKSDSGHAEHFFHSDDFRALVVVTGAVSGGLDFAVVPTTEFLWRDVTSALGVTSDMLVLPVRNVFGDEPLAIPSGNPTAMDQFKIAVAARLGARGSRYSERKESGGNPKG